MNKRAVISFASDRGNYYKSLDRLEESLKGRTDADVIMYRDEESIGAPDHMLNHYSFKIFGFAHTLRKKKEKILWLDSSVYAVENLSPIFDLIDRDGYVMQEAGHMCGTWASDATLEYFNITRDDAMEMPMYGNAGFLGLDFNYEISNMFFNMWSKCMLSGLFMFDWNNTDNHLSQDPRCKGDRTDMVCGSIIANLLGMKYQKGDEILEYASPEMPIKNETIILRAAGM